MTSNRATIARSFLLGLVAFAWSIPGVSAMSPQECYKRDSNCTKFCGEVKDADWRHECFMRCNKYLDNCLSRGEWTDQNLTYDPGTGSTPTGPKLGTTKVPTGGLLDASPGLPTQGPAGGAGITGGAAPAGSVLK